MAATIDKPIDFSPNVPGITPRGLALLNSLTADTIWDATELRYYFGNGVTLESYGDLAWSYDSMVRHAPDASFYFSTLTERAYAMIDGVSTLDFSKTTDLAEADHVLVSFNSPKAAIEGYFEFPGTLYRDVSPFDSLSLGAINSGMKVMTALPELAGDGEYANWTLLHEIGHGLGLLHTHNEFNGRALKTVGKYMDNERYSVMSYNGANNANGFGHAVSYMALDVAALQALYGAEDYALSDSTYTMYNAGDSTLSLEEGSVKIGRAYYCIWDAGDGVDQINYGSSDKSVMINLNDATLDASKPTGDLKALIGQIRITGFFKDLSSALQDEITDAWHHAGGFFSRVLDVKHGDYKGTGGGFSIAHGAVIEDANGGNMADMLIGNEANNTLYGFGGNDTMLGGSGNDTLDGGDGKDRLDGGIGNDTLTGGLNADVFVFSTGYGTDEITDFEAGDRIDLRRMKEIVNFKDLANHMTQDGDDVFITAGMDVLVIKDRTIAELDLTKADFLF